MVTYFQGGQFGKEKKTVGKPEKYYSSQVIKDIIGHKSAW